MQKRSRHPENGIAESRKPSSRQRGPGRIYSGNSKCSGMQNLGRRVSSAVKINSRS